MLRSLIEKMMEIYVDNTLTKSLKAKNHVSDLKKTFNILRKYQMKLNPKKCAFRVFSGKFLSFMVAKRGIEANLEKIRAIVEIRSLQNMKEVQKFTGKMVALNKFLAMSSDRCETLFKSLKVADGWKWTPNSEESFQRLKEVLN